MKILLALLLSIPPVNVALPPRQLAPIVQTHRGGQWYMAADGHAVYCYGGSHLIPDRLNGGFKRIATFCRGDKVIVDLKE